MPWQSRHKNRKERAALIVIVLGCAIAVTIAVAANISSIGSLFEIFVPHG